jgi:hypothetical protein
MACRRPGLAATASEIYLSTRSRSQVGQFPGLTVRPEAKIPFTRLTPDLLSSIPADVLPGAIADRIRLPQHDKCRVHDLVLREGLSELRGDSPVIEISVGPDFKRLTPGRITKFAELVPVMAQANDARLSSEIVQIPGASFNVAFARVAHENRGVRAQLGGHRFDCSCVGEHIPGEYRQKLGVLFIVDRLYVSDNDYVIAWVPLNIEVLDVLSKP